MKTIQELKNKLKEAKKEAFKNAKTKQEVIVIWNEDKRNDACKK